ncbi:MAG: type II secretion system protein F, partial [Lachnospiraceae bacterium]|nr:type II secretion system protein F [Lachnospiraceae bacterium]
MKNKTSKMGIGRGRHPPILNYAVYHFSKKELTIYAVLESAFIGMTAYLFYDSIFAFLLLMPLAVVFLKKKKEQLCRKRKRKLEAEFRDVILSVSSNLQAGYSFENAFQEAYKEIVILYGGESLMACELRLLLRKLANNEQLEDVLLNLAKRSGVQDIRDFADIFQIEKRGGGNMQAIIANTAEVIGDKQAVRSEIDTIMS